MRKVLGSPRKYLIAQFLTESVLVTLAGAILAVGLAWAVLPLFNEISGKEPAVNSLLIGRMVTVLLVVSGAVPVGVSTHRGAERHPREPKGANEQRTRDDVPAKFSGAGF